MLIYGIIEQISVTLQGIDSAVNYCYCSAEVCIKWLKSAVQMNNFTNSLRARKMKQPTSVITLFYQEITVT